MIRDEVGRSCMCLGRYSTRLPERVVMDFPTSNPERFCGARNSLEAEINSDARCRSELAISASLLFSARAASPIVCVVYAIFMQITSRSSDKI